VRSRDYEEFIEFLNQLEARYLDQDKADLKVLRQAGKKRRPVAMPAS